MSITDLLTDVTFCNVLLPFLSILRSSHKCQLYFILNTEMSVRDNDVLWESQSLSCRYPKLIQLLLLTLRVLFFADKTFTILL